MNYIWFLLILISIIFGAINGKLSDVISAILTGTQKSIEITLYLIGIMAFWLGLMKIAEKSGVVDFVAKLVYPFFSKIFSEIKDNKKAIGHIAMNFSANAFGLANAATPLGLMAMEEMQKENKNKKTASNSMCMLLGMNTAGFQLIPATVIAILAASGDKNPTIIVFPTLIVTFIAFTFAIFVAKVFEKIWKPQEVERND